MKKKIIISIVVILCIIIAAAGGSFLYINSKLSKVNKVKISKNTKDLGINDDMVKKANIDDDYVNILFLGIDSRDTSTDAGRSDVTIIMTIDKKHQKIKLTSLMRDSIETMVGHGPMEGKNQDRLNHAYAYGGPALSIKTVNENYNMNIKDYVKVDFFGLEKIIDYVGGVEINVTNEELPILNSYIKEVATIEKKSPKFLTKSGTQHLSGSQAVGYCRIRYVGNADFQRTERQRTVLTQLINKLTSIDKSKLPDVANNILPNVETSMDTASMYKLGVYLVTNRPTKIEQLRLPIDGANFTQYVGDTYFVGWDKDINLKALQKFITEE